LRANVFYAIYFPYCQSFSVSFFKEKRAQIPSNINWKNGRLVSSVSSTFRRYTTVQPWK